MSKKSRKQTRKTSTTAARPAVVMSTNNPAVSLRAADTEFKPDYSQTIKDLKRIGALAGTFFVVLVILSFFLR
jgi:hypothetical protein